MGYTLIRNAIEFTPSLVRSDFFQTPSPPRMQDPVVYPKGKTPATRDPTAPGLNDSIADGPDPITSHPRQQIPFAVTLARGESKHQSGPPSSQHHSHNDGKQISGYKMTDYAFLHNGTLDRPEMNNLDEDDPAIFDPPRSSPAAERLERLRVPVSRSVNHYRPREVGTDLPSTVATSVPPRVQDTPLNSSRRSSISISRERLQRVNRTGDFSASGSLRARRGRSTGYAGSKAKRFAEKFPDLSRFRHKEK